MRPTGLRSEARAMNTNTANPQGPDTNSQARTDQPFGFRTGSTTALRRPFQGRMLAGVAAGAARYLGIDPVIIRIAFVVLTFAGGAGIPLYLAGLLLIPDEGSDQSIAGSLFSSQPSR
jgi:phage shock protein PspC (stress-responsive transcriptional regulator)